MLPVLAVISSLCVMPAHAQDGGDLAKQSQNPLGTVISLPFENNLLFNIGPSEKTGYVLNMEHPVNAPNWSLRFQGLGRHSEHESSRLKGV